jgi:hypothetical protein
LAVTGIVELGEHVETIHSHLPEWAKMHSQDVIVTLLIGLVIYLISTHGEGVQHETSTQPVSTLKAESNPTQKLQQNPQQNNYFYGTPPPTSPMPVEKSKKTHNVKFIGFREIPESKNYFKSFVATFENFPIPNKEIADFLNAKAKVEVSSIEEDSCLAMPSMWLDQDNFESVNLSGGLPQHVVIAIYIGNKWRMQKIVQKPSSYGMIYEPEGMTLAEGEYTVAVTLIGSQNMSTPPVAANFTIRDDGQLSYTPLSV